MKNKIVLLGMMVLAALILAACGGVSSAAGAGEIRTVSVNGTGKVIVTPDMATINVGVVTEGQDAEEATSQNNQHIAEITEVLTGMGVAEADIKTSNFSVYPMQNFDREGEPAAVIYRVENNVRVVVREIDQLGSILDAVVGAGANSIYGVEFDLSDRESAFSQAIDAAMQNAEDRAGLLAQSAGAELGELQSVETYLGGGGVPMYAESAAMGAFDGAAEVPVSPGEMEIQVEVNVVYAIQ